MKSIASYIMLLACALLSAKTTADVGNSQTFASKDGQIKALTIAEGLENPWGLAFLPDGRMLVTERPGRLRIVNKDGSLSKPVSGVPKVAARGQGGLLDVVLHPKFSDNSLIYISFSEPGSGGASTAVVKARFENDALIDTQVIFRQEPKVDTGHHFGSRLVFDRDGKLFISSGDRHIQPNVQMLNKGQGKLFRINDDGSIPSDNPFVKQKNAIPAIWSYGHRNIQGMAIHLSTGAIWTHEHGARGGDEINIAKASKNYGWPVITHGINYNGNPIGDGIKEKAGMEQPHYVWTPSIGPSGLTFYTADRFPAWKGKLFVGALAFQLVAKLTLDGDKIVAEERLLEGYNQRIRDVRQGPDGYLYLLTDSDKGRVVQLSLM